MAHDYRFTCPLPMGMHARPASALEHVARRFTCDISIHNGRTGQSTNAKSVLGIVGLDIRHGDPCRVLAVGRDAAWAVESLRMFVERTLPHADDVTAVVEERAEAILLPPMLRGAGAVVMPGVAVVAGIGVGHAFKSEGFRVPASLPLTGVEDVDEEVRRIEEGLGRLLQRYDDRIAGGDGRVEADVLRAHRSVARDPEFGQMIVQSLQVGRRTAAGAIVDAESQLTGMLAATGSTLLRERALDIHDVCCDLLSEVYGPGLWKPATALTRPSVCLADTLTPGQFLALDRTWLRGLVLAHGGTTSHTVILARSHGIPTIVGVGSLEVGTLDGHLVVVDADLGALVSALTERARRYYDMEQRRLDARGQRVRRFASRPAATEDGHRIEVAANIGAASDVRDALAAGAEGVGLFRTEMLFLARKNAPSEDEQFDEYRRAVVDAGQRPVIVRTLDVGGDKRLPYLALPREDNPFLGYRAVRLYREFDALFRTQVRALLRASSFGPLRLMVPMVTSADEIRWVRGVIKEEQDRLEAAGADIDRRLPVGAMIEVPSAAFMIPELSGLLDFFSIGTNDLLQYFVAADRTNPRVASIANPLEPPFLRLLAKVVNDAHAQGRWVGLCGDLAGQPRVLPLLVGLGLDELSVAAPVVASVKAMLSALSSDRCRSLVDRALQATSAAEVAQLLDNRGHWRVEPLLEPDLVALDADVNSKEEAIKAAADRLFVAGRTDHPREIEDIAWRCEPTLNVQGVAVAHAVTDAVATTSVAVVRLRAGVPWSPGDRELVHTVILAAVREADDAAVQAVHVQLPSTLARRLATGDVREAIRTATGVEALCAAVERLLASSG